MEGDREGLHPTGWIERRRRFSIYSVFISRGAGESDEKIVIRYRKIRNRGPEGVWNSVKNRYVI